MTHHKHSRASASSPAPEVAPQAPAAVHHEQTAGNAAMQDAMREHTVFVRGTYSDSIEEREGRYFEPGMMESANELLGADSSSEFDWFGGPLSGPSRDVAGRKLLREEVMPAVGRGEQVNLVGHSHGGNVMGEMAAHYAHRLDYLSTLAQGARDPESQAAALEAIESVRAERQAELEHFTSWPGRRSLDDDRTQQTDILGELAALEGDELSLRSGDATGFEQELALLQSAQFGDVMNLNTPYLNQHEAVTEVEPFADRVEQFTDVIGTRDPTAFLGRLHEGVFGHGSRTLPPHERSRSLTWDLEDPGWFDKRRHTGVLEESVFDRAVAGPLSAQDD